MTDSSRNSAPAPGATPGTWRARFGDEIARVLHRIPTIPWPWMRVAIAILLAASVNWAYRATAPAIGGSSAFLVLAFLAVIASAWVGRFFSGLLTLLLCVGLWTYYFSVPAKSFRLSSLEDVRLVLLFLGVGVLLVLIVEALYSGKAYGDAQAREKEMLAESLLTERHRTSALLANLPGIVWEVRVEPGGAAPQATFFSANASRLLHRAPDRLVGSTSLWSELLPEPDRNELLAALREVARGGASRSVRHRWRDGDSPLLGGTPIPRERTFETHIGAGDRERSGLVRCVSIEVDSEERVQQALAESERRFRAAADRAPILLWIVRPSAGIVWANRTWLDFRGRSLELEQGLGWVEGVHPDDARDMSSGVLDELQGREEFRFEFRVRRADGAWRWILAIGVPRLGPDGSFQDYLGFCVDMSERKQIELDRELLLEGTEKARLAAESAIRSKDEFLATISHELRNPLNGILGWTQILRRGGSDEEEVTRGIELIDMSARTLVQLVDDLLDISRITAGKMRLALTPTDLKRVVDAACQSISPSAQAKGLTLDCRVPAGLPSVLGDARRLQQISWNLLANAVKFTPRGGRVEIDAEQRDGHVVLTVRDTGIGIPAEFIQQVFDPFSQHESTSTRRYRGLGLGLAIVRNLTELHGGRVRATSDGPDRGSTFEVAIPVAMDAEVDTRDGDARPENGTHAGRLAGVRVLVVDDDPAAREMLPLLLGRAGATSHTADSAEAGLSALLSFRPHVLLSDIEMPATDGYAFLRRVRALADDDGGAVPAAALTAYVREEERQRILLAGFQAHLGKPVDAAELVETVARLAGRSESPAS